MAPIQGELQAQVMSALWRLGTGTVEQVRSALPPRYRGAYNTVQTVLNRLTDRGLLARSRAGRGFVYRPKVTEAEYLSRTMRHAMAGASAEARQAALAELLGSLSASEASEVRRLADAADRVRRSRDR